MYRITYVIILIAEPFEETEEKWLSSLENTRWLEYVRFVQLLFLLTLYFEIIIYPQEVQKYYRVMHSSPASQW